MGDEAEETKLFLLAEINAIDKAKYIESQKANKDLYYDDQGKPTQTFYLDWIKSHGKEFRDAWKESVCRFCKNTMFCKDCLRKECENFVVNPEVAPTYKEFYKSFIEKKA
jgi:hypothetical protein